MPFVRAASIAVLMVVTSTATAAGPPTPPVATQLEPTQSIAIDTFIASEMQRQQIPGVAVGIYRHGTVLLAKGYGLANVEHGVPVKPETIFQSGSVGKQFVSAAILLLAEEGRVALDDPITKYFPEGPAEWRSIRVEHLLSHTSGLAEYETPERTGPKGPFYLRLDFTEDELVQRIGALPIEAAPATKWDYRNTNYVLLGILIHRVTGMPFGDFLARRIFEPLGMSSTRIISDADIVRDRAAGYELEAGVLKNQAWVSPTFNATGDGTLYFNVSDLARWDAALGDTRLLRRSSLDRLWTVFPMADGQPNPAGYGFAWFIGKQNDRLRIEHSGAWQGFAADLSRYPDDGLTVVVLANLDAGHARAGYMAHVIAGLVVPPLMPPRLVAIDDDDSNAAAAVRQALDRLSKGADLTSVLTSRMTAGTDEADLVDMRKALSMVGSEAVMTLVERRPAASGLQVSLFRLVRGDRSLLVAARLDSSGLIDSLRITPDRDYR